MKKVLEVIYRFDYGGIESFILNCINQLDPAEYQIDIYVYGSSESPHLDYLKTKGINIYFDPENDIINKKIVRFVKKLVRFIHNGNYDVVHAHCNLISSWVVLAAWLCRVPVRISHAHSAMFETRRLVQRLWCSFRRKIIKIFATNKVACGQLAGEKMYGMKENFTVILNGIQPERFSKEDTLYLQKLREEFRIPVGSRVYANITRWDPPKNHPFMVEVMKEIHAKDPSSIFIVGGTNPPISSTYNKCIEKIKEYGLEECTRLTEPRNDLPQLYHLVDCWIFPSAFEGLPFIPLELQAASVPCLCSDVVTREIDLGVGLIEFLSLKQSPKRWAEAAIAFEKPVVNEKTVQRKLKEKGFDLSSNMDKLKYIYDGEKLLK